MEQKRILKQKKRPNFEPVNANKNMIRELNRYQYFGPYDLSSMLDWLEKVYIESADIYSFQNDEFEEKIVNSSIYPCLEKLDHCYYLCELHVVNEGTLDDYKLESPEELLEKTKEDAVALAIIFVLENFTFF